MNPSQELVGQVAIVTGASRGIGRAIAAELHAAGAHVIVNYRSSKGAAEALASALKDRVTLVQADVSTAEGVNALLEAADEFGGPTILVNNAGITDDNLAVRMSDDQWERVMTTNATSAFRLSRGVMLRMVRKRAGAIVNIVSVAGIRGNPGQANYSASKAAVIGLTRTLACEMGKRNIRVNAVAPGFIETDIIDGVKESVLDNAKAMIPMRRLGKPEEIAPVVRFLVGPGAAYMTGQVVAVDGGMSV